MNIVNTYRAINDRGSMLYLTLIMMALIIGISFTVYAAKDDCTNIDGDGAVPIKEVGKEDVGVTNDYDEVVEEDERKGVVYLALIGGDTPKPNACGLIPKNPAGEWTGWGGPLNFDNVTIGEGGGTRNHIVIGGTLFVRGFGNHAIGTLVYDLSGGKYVKFEAYVGMSDEKDPGGCGHGGSSDFTFSIDGKQTFKSETLKGSEGGENVEAVKVEFDIPNGAKELTIVMGDGGDGIGCDHSTVGDAKLLTSQALAVDPANKVSTTWGSLKASY